MEHLIECAFVSSLNLFFVSFFLKEDPHAGSYLIMFAFIIASRYIKSLIELTTPSSFCQHIHLCWIQLNLYSENGRLAFERVVWTLPHNHLWPVWHWPTHKLHWLIAIVGFTMWTAIWFYACVITPFIKVIMLPLYVRNIPLHFQHWTSAFPILNFCISNIELLHFQCRG